MGTERAETLIRQIGRFQISQCISKWKETGRKKEETHPEEHI
jgi:hypothetical protein